MEQHQLMQIDQWGAKQNVSGTIDNTLIDDMVLRDAILHRQYLFGFWVDVRKAFLVNGNVYHPLFSSQVNQNYHKHC